MSRDRNGARGYAPSGKDTGIVKSKGTARLPVLEGRRPLAADARKPAWLKVRSPGGPNYSRLRRLMRQQRLHSVCEEAGCPNIGECWEAGTATFLILGDVCTRACKYCAIAHGMPTELDWDEPRRVGEAVAELELEHVVVTSVNRDELDDGGAAIFAETIRECRRQRPGCTVEVLIPDFKGDEAALRAVVDARPDILNHNLETVERLHPWARPGARYWRSISLLGAAKRLDPSGLTKSGVMLGLGEEPEEIRQALVDLRKASVDIVTLGQYLRPSVHHAPVARWVTPVEFAEWKRVGEEELGFRHVESGPLVRSSYHAETQARVVQAGGVGEIREIMEADVPAPAEVRAGDTAPLAGAGNGSGTAGAGNGSGTAGTGNGSGTAGAGNGSGAAGAGNGSGTAGTGNESGTAGTGNGSGTASAANGPAPPGAGNGSGTVRAADGPAPAGAGNGPAASGDRGAPAPPVRAPGGVSPLVQIEARRRPSD